MEEPSKSREEVGGQESPQPRRAQGMSGTRLLGELQAGFPQIGTGTHARSEEAWDFETAVDGIFYQPWPGSMQASLTMAPPVQYGVGDRGRTPAEARVSGSLAGPESNAQGSEWERRGTPRSPATSKPRPSRL